MKNLKTGFSQILLLTIIGILILSGGIIYFYPSKQTKTTTQLKKIIAENKEIDSPNDTVKNTYLYLRIQAMMEEQTDTMFNNPNSTKPEIKVKIDGEESKTINDKRLEITNLMNAWSKDLIQSSIISNNNIDEISAKSIADINSRLTDLKNLIYTLSPSNSGLSQEEIDQYQQFVSNTQNAIIPPPTPTEQPINSSDFVYPPETFDLKNPRLIEGVNRR